MTKLFAIRRPRFARHFRHRHTAADLGRRTADRAHPLRRSGADEGDGRKTRQLRDAPYLSSQTDPKRGIGASLKWTEAEFRKLGLEVVTPSEVLSGPRIPNGVKITDVIAIQRGTERPNDVVIITGHIDSRVSDVMNATADAPGANDDGSGTAAVIEAARVLSKHKFPGTIVYAALMGEEQGLFGGKVLANYAKAQGWNVIANLNNDIIGNSCGSDGVCDDKTVRVFSEGPRWQGMKTSPSRSAAWAGKTTARRATSRASSTRWPSGCPKSAST